MDNLISENQCKVLIVTAFVTFGLFVAYSCFIIYQVYMEIVEDQGHTECSNNVYHTIIWLLVPYVIGVLLSTLYTAGPFPLKYNCLGDLAVFLAFGPCIAIFTAFYSISMVFVDGHGNTMQNATPTLMCKNLAFDFLSNVAATVCIRSIPIAICISGILHANNLRDIESDSKAHITTLAIKLGHIKSRKYFGCLLFAAHTTALLQIPQNLGMACSCFLIPYSIWLYNCRSFKREDLINLDEETAELQLLFSISLVIGVYCNSFLINSVQQL